ncbi:MAG: vWA domain-containing protein [Coriobacteriales bacterium]|nr:vWA domain-containing protein [Coriobacteriales bacterium]
MGKKRVIIGMAVGLVVISALVFGILILTRNVGKTERTVDAENAKTQLADMVRRIDPSTATPKKSSVEYSEKDTTAEELPALDTNAVTCEETTASFAEIWSSPEKAGQGTDGWMREMAEAFNASGAQVDGQKVSIRLRTMSSGLGVDYISTGKEHPAGFSPSNMLLIDLLAGKGIKCDVIRERMVGNVAGILLDEEHYNSLMDKYGTVDLKAITEAVGTGNLTMGYTNPFTSSTGFNFLVSTLLRYDRDNPLSGTAADGFRQFQANVPFVALTTVQMRDAAERGSLDGFVLEWQLYQNDPSLSSNYTFVPFGYRHDNPLVACPTASDTERKILELFAQYCDDNGKDLANRYGFNGKEDYVSELPEITGETLVAAQDLYKKNKDTGRPVIAVFVADVSGSMNGAPLAELQNSLINSMRYINTDNFVGMASYSDYVTIELPVDQFNLNQQALFKGAVENLTAGGGTATHDGIIVAAKMVEDALAEHPDAKPMIFVLSDGETNADIISFEDMKAVIGGLRIPVYTIGYNANISALQNISNINEAASIDASTDDVTYQLRNLFNANM